MSQNGKGDDSRPLSVSKKQYDENYERIFGKKEEVAPEEYKKLLASGMFWELFPQLTGTWRLDRYDWDKLKGEHNAPK